MDKGEKRSDGQTISRAVAILKAVAARPGASFGQIAKATDLPRSTVQRLIGVLNQEGLVTKAFGQQGTYLGMELARLGAQVRLDARALLRPFMEDLHAEIGDNIDLTTLEDGKVFVIEQIASNEAIRVISYVGLQHPIHCTANGKAHLSMLDRATARALIGAEPKAYTPNTRTDPEALLDEIDAARHGGLFADNQEYDEGASAVAIPLPRIGDKDFAISIAMPTQRMERQRDAVQAALLSLRAKVVAEYGSSI
ncbi:MAG: IclR family transcriptional regulator [Roseivivax sp.]|nr:IclR family transcriptional regulator [Roseivivax sp.]